MWVNGRYPGIGASPDGLLFDAHTNSWSVLEIKCPKSLQSVALCEFADHLSAKQVKAFCLQKSPDGLLLKTNHAYYYQMQLQMGVCEVQWGYFVVWTPLGVHATFFSAIVATLTNFSEGEARLRFADILMFATGADAIPPCGFDFSPSLEFLPSSPSAIYPTANTCSNVEYETFKETFEFAILNAVGFGQA